MHFGQGELSGRGHQEPKRPKDDVENGMMQTREAPIHLLFPSIFHNIKIPFFGIFQRLLHEDQWPWEFHETPLHLIEQPLFVCLIPSVNGLMHS